jgi:hypothetical protein
MIEKAMRGIECMIEKATKSCRVVLKRFQGALGTPQPDAPTTPWVEQ